MDVGTLEIILKLRDEASQALQKAGGEVQSFGMKMVGAGAALTAATAPLALFGKAALETAMDAVEAQNLFAVSFGEAAGAADAWAASLSSASLQTQTDLKASAGMLYTMTTGMGLAKDAAFDMSTGLVELAGDMSSFYNIPVDEALTKLRAGITGETEPLKRLGILVDEATIKTTAYEHGLAKLGDELTQQQKVQARYLAIMDQTKNAQGDLARTIDSPSNQMKKLSKDVKELEEAFGKALLPAMTAIIGFVSTTVMPALKWLADVFANMPKPIQGVVVALGLVVVAIGPLLMAAGALVASLGALAPILPVIGAGFHAMLGPLGLVTLAITGLVALFAVWQSKQAAANAIAEKGVDVQKTWTAEQKASYDAFVKQQQAATEAWKASKAGTKSLEEETAAAMKATQEKDKLAAASKVLGREVTSLAEATKVLAYADAHSEEKAKKHRAEVEKATKAYKEMIHEATAAAEAQARGVGFVIPKLPELTQPKQDMMQIADGAWKAAQAIEKQALELAKAGVPADTLRAKMEAAGMTASQIEAALARVRLQQEQAARAANTWGNALKTSVLGALKTLPQVILGAIQGGGDVGKAIGAHLGGSIGEGLGAKLTPILTKSLGKTLGEGLGSLAGPLGSIVGSLAGKLGGKLFGAIGGLFKNKAKEAAKEAKAVLDDFVKGQGGLEDLKRRAAEAGVSLDAMFQAKTKDQMLRAIDEVKAKMDLWNQAQDKLHSTMEKYGITIDQLGPKFRQQELDKQALTLLEDFKLLQAAGVDINTIMAAMGPNLTEYVNTAIKAGSTIPEAMRPVIEQMIAAGQLLDENGNAYASAEAAGIQFGKTQSEMFDALLEKIDQLVAALTGIPTERTTTVTVRTRREEEGAPAGPPPPHGGSEPEGYASGSGGFLNFGKGTPAVLHGMERVQTAQQYQQEQANIGAMVAAAIDSQTAKLAKVFRDAVLKGV